MAKPKVLVSNSDVPDEGLELLRQECEMIVVPGRSPSREAILQHIPQSGVDAIYWCSKEFKLDAEFVDAAGPGLRAVATMSSGYDLIDTDLLKRRGIPLGNTAHVLDDTVADTAVALVIMTTRRLQVARRCLERGLWVTGRSQFIPGLDVTGATFGIVGLGGIGQAFAKRIKAFNIGKLQYSGPRPKPEASALGAEFVSFDELVRSSDIIVLTCPLTAETKDLFNAQVFEKMKSSSILINVSRGDCIDQEALVDALKTNKIWGAGLDVMCPEPLPVDHPLISMDNCVLLPHVGSATVRTRTAMAVLAAKNILCSLKGQPMPSPVNIR